MRYVTMNQRVSNSNAKRKPDAWTRKIVVPHNIFFFFFLCTGFNAQGTTLAEVYDAEKAFYSNCPALLRTLCCQYDESPSQGRSKCYENVCCAAARFGSLPLRSVKTNTRSEFQRF